MLPAPEWYAERPRNCKVYVGVSRTRKKHPGSISICTKGIGGKSCFIEVCLGNLRMASTTRKIGIANQVCPVLPNSAGRVVDSGENCEWLARTKCNKAVDHPP